MICAIIIVKGAGRKSGALEAARYSAPVRAGLLMLLLWCVSGCSLLFPAPTPMRAVHGGDSASRCLVVFLPGLGDSADDYLKNGFLDAAKAAGVTAQLVAVNATLGYYIRRSLVDRLRDDVLTPARASGVTSIHLVGISLGGLGALFAAQQAGPIDSVPPPRPVSGGSRPAGDRREGRRALELDAGRRAQRRALPARAVDLAQVFRPRAVGPRASTSASETMTS